MQNRKVQLGQFRCSWYIKWHVYSIFKRQMTDLIKFSYTLRDRTLDLFGKKPDQFLHHFLIVRDVALWMTKKKKKDRRGRKKCIIVIRFSINSTSWQDKYVTKYHIYTHKNFTMFQHYVLLIPSVLILSTLEYKNKNLYFHQKQLPPTPNRQETQIWRTSVFVALNWPHISHASGGTLIAVC